MTEPSPLRIRFVSLSVLTTVVLFALLQGAALTVNGGVFEYPLDDVYIHLAMAENIAIGGYGVNPGEYSSAASSPLYPFLLLPVIGAEFQRFLPLIWNFLALVALAWLWAEILVEAGYDRWGLRLAGHALAMVGPAVVLGVPTAYVGMEHVLHAAASLAILLGLFRYLNGKPGSVLLLLGILLAPLLRLEGLALALLASAALFAAGARSLAIIAGCLAVVPALGFAGFLMSLGLDPLPGSVVAKMALGRADDLGFLQGLVFKLRINLEMQGGWLLALITGSVWGLLLVSERLRSGPMRLLGMVIFLAGLAHLLFGQLGWMNRYEHYIFAVVCAGFLILLPEATARLSRAVASALALLPFLALLIVYLPGVVGYFPLGSRAIHTQQGQMASFAQDHLNAPVAVNDLGRVAWGNSNYVLDLIGLGSAEAREIRLNDPEPGWAGPLAEKHQVPVAMIYDNWLGSAAPSGWVPVGALFLKKPEGFLGGARVAFYATGPEHVGLLQDALQSWVPTLSDLAYFKYAEAAE